MLKIGIIGCGKIADEHAAQIQRIAGCEVVGVCDQEELMAKQLYERFKIGAYFRDARSMIETTRPDIVHITTPPQSHFQLGALCLENGCHVYIEKPFTLNADEATRLINLATEKKLKITVGHDAAFNHAERRMRELIGEGYLGGSPVHMESYYCYNFGDTYAKALTGDKDHWVRKLPGKLLHNVISHGICKIAEYLPADYPTVIAHGYTSSQLRGLGETEIIDELRVIIDDNGSTTAYFTFSSQMRPTLHQFRVYGPRNGLIVDHNHQTCIKLRGAKYTSYLDTFVPPMVFAKQYAANAMNNVNRFLRNDFHMKSGMKFLMESFYRSVAIDTPPPIPYREIILTSRIMDSIFAQIGRGKTIHVRN
ncbi:MAG: Gfo/Idh/MocA family oxidoreductase [Syntrophorhabdales bacterium]